jgi:ATP-dependent protease Clp ATPase subunit
MRIRKLRCSFCRKTADQIAKLAAGRPKVFLGPKVYICNECVAAANAIMQGDSPPTPAISRSLLQKVKERCRHYLQLRAGTGASEAG